MAISPEQLLGYVPLMQSVEVKLKGIPRVLDPKFWSLTEPTVTDKGRYIEYSNNRQSAIVAPYGSPPKQVNKIGVGQRDFKLIHSIESITYSQELLAIFQKWDSYEPQRKNFMEQITFMGEQFASRQDNLRTACVQSNMATGFIFFDASGNVLPSAAGADLIVDQGVPAANRGGCGVCTAGTPWSDPNTDIVSQVNNLKTRAIRDTGRVLKTAYYSKNVMGYITRNTSMKDYLARNSTYNDKFMNTGQLPTGMLDLDWVPVQDAYFEDANGVNQDVFPIDQVTFTPELSKDWYTMYEGTYMIPSKFGVFASAEEALGSLIQAPGMFRFGFLNMSPVITIGETHGDTFLPRFKVPGCIYYLDTTP